MAQMKVEFENEKRVLLVTTANTVKISTPSGAKFEIELEDLPELLRAINLFLIAQDHSKTIAKLILGCDRLKEVVCDDKTKSNLQKLIGHEL